MMRKRKIPTETLIEIIGSLLGILGVSLALVGLAFQHLFPWITFKKVWVLPQLGSKPWIWVYYHVSPFLISYRLEGDIPRYQWFYKIDTTLVGVICFIGAMIGLIGVFTRTRKINLAGGIIVMISLIAFGTCLPGQYPYISWGFGARLTLFGSLVIIVSSMIGYFNDDLQQKQFLHKRLIELWQERVHE